MKRLRGAVQFLTIVPLGEPTSLNETDLRASVAFYPTVGLCIGALAAIVAWGTSQILTPAVSAILVVFTLTAVSGGLHIDGLADTADGFFSCRSRDRMLEIMKDSRIGTMGVLAIIFIILLKVTALAALAPSLRWRTALLMPVAGRVALVTMLGMLDYARSEGGLGKSFFARQPATVYAAALAILVLTALLLGPVAAVATLTATALVIMFHTLQCKRKIGGGTGDTLGAGCELVETIVALVVLSGS